MPTNFNTLDLEAYLDEALPPERMSEVEQALRADAQLGRRLAAINARRDQGVHSLGEIWRQHRLSCPTREQLGSFLLGALSEEQQNYFEFHLQVACCRLCQANLADLQSQQASLTGDVESRRRKYFQSSAGLLKK